MGRRGPRPAPTSLKLVKGTRSDRVNTDEPVPEQPVDELQAPEWMTSHEVALEIWAEYAPDLQRKGVLTAWDVEAFAICCETAARRRKAVARIKAEGEITTVPVFDRNGKPAGMKDVRNPWLTVLAQADRQLLSWAARFGMTPSDRAQLGGGTKQRDPYEDLLTA